MDQVKKQKEERKAKKWAEGKLFELGKIDTTKAINKMKIGEELNVVYDGKEFHCKIKDRIKVDDLDTYKYTLEMMPENSYHYEIQK